MINSTDIVYKIPPQLKFQTVHKAVRELASLPLADVVELDFSPVKFANPFGALFLAEALRDVVEERSKNGLITTVSASSQYGPACGYLEHIGFFAIANLGREAGRLSRSGSRKFMPITELSKGLMGEEAGSRVHEAIRNKSEHLAEIIAQGDDAVVGGLLPYSLCEIIRNVFEHARTDRCLVVGQRWDNGFAEIAIADRGVGIFETLRTFDGILNARDALAAAIKAGVSSSASLTVDTDEWGNAGFGLFVLSELGGNYGSFAIASGGRYLRVWPGGTEEGIVPCRGTSVMLRVNTQDASQFSTILHAIVKKGELEASTHGAPGAGGLRASKTRLW